MNWLFDWRPGLWTPLLMTISNAIGLTASYPTLPKDKRPSFLSDVIENIGVAFAGHFGIVLYIFVLVIPTRLLAENEDISPEIIAAVTGVVFPFLAFLTRKAFSGVLGKYFLGKLHRGEIDKDTYLRSYNRLVKVMSVSVLTVPTLLLYLDRTITYAVLSAITQIATEVVAKCVVAHMEKKMFKLQREDADETQLNFALGMLALRWNAEIVGEKR